MTKALWITAVIGGNLLAALSARATVVNLDFNSSSHFRYAGQGALVTADAHYWNPGDPAGDFPTWSNLRASDSNTITSVSVTLGGGSGVLYYNPGSVNNALMEDVVYQRDYLNGTPCTFSIGGLSTTKVYDLYLYTAKGIPANWNTYFQIGGVTNYLGGNSTTGPWPPFVLGKDYVKFSSVAPNGSGVISGSWSAIPGVGANFSGLQILDVVIPEPSSMALLIMGTGGILVWRRRRPTSCERG